MAVIRIAIYANTITAAEAKADAERRGQTVSQWFNRAASLALSPAGRVALQQLADGDGSAPRGGDVQLARAADATGRELQRRRSGERGRNDPDAPLLGPRTRKVKP
jgi:hypothetical protein